MFKWFLFEGLPVQHFKRVRLCEEKINYDVPIFKLSNW